MLLCELITLVELVDALLPSVLLNSRSLLSGRIIINRERESERRERECEKYHWF